jgi:CRISPR-associated endonuclease/helicase Cas3
VEKYMQALTDLAADLDISLEKCAQRFGTVTLPKNDNGWRFHPALGFTKAKT